jgi:hypothetical protein
MRPGVGAGECGLHQRCCVQADWLAAETMEDLRSVCRLYWCAGAVCQQARTSGAQLTVCAAIVLAPAVDAVDCIHGPRELHTASPI